MAKLSKRLEKELDQAKIRLIALQAKHEQERSAMDAAEAHARERITFLEGSLANAQKFEGVA
jgi:hypothetical protein